MMLASYQNCGSNPRSYVYSLPLTPDSEGLGTVGRLTAMGTMMGQGEVGALSQNLVACVHIYL